VNALTELRWNLPYVKASLRPRQTARLTRLWLGERRGRRAYRELDEQELLRTRRSDTAFVFGSGRSLVDIDDESWRRIAEHDVIAFSHFHRQHWVRVDYHLVAEAHAPEETGASLAANPRYADTVFVVESGWLAQSPNLMVARRLLPAGSRIFRVRRVGRGGRPLPPSRSFRDGLVHGTGTIQDVVNFAIIGGWRRIVVAGVDLYNKEYFWLPPETTRAGEHAGVSAADPFPQAGLLADALGRWRELLAPEGLELLVYDGRSVLARTLPVFAW
jgi:hypothetical protein